MEMKPRFLALEGQVRKTIAGHGMLSGGERVLVAVSGGADSVALLHCLRRLAPGLGLTLAVAHLNHRLRGEESDQDENCVREICAQLSIPFFSESADVGGQAASARHNLEEAAREVRYDFLRRTAVRAAAQKIALGHTLDDQAETVLMRFLRGSGSKGLSAIHPVVKGLLIRPLLECRRRNILEYLRIRGIQFREDSSNSDLKFRRNRMRRELIPYLEKHFNPRLTDTLVTAADLARDVAAYVESQARSVFESIRTWDEEGLALPVGPILELHPALQKELLRIALRECRGTLRGITSRHIDANHALCRPLHSGRRIELPCGTAAVRQFSRILFLAQLPSASPEFSYDLPIPGRCLVAEAGLEFIAAVTEPVEGAGDSVKSGLYKAILDAASLPQHLTVRPRRPGDRYGGPRHRKVKKMMIDAKVPLSARSRLPVLASGETVIWVPGFLPAKPYIPKAYSCRYVLVEVHERTRV
jgi:tRNA(Ile)-lysidine synthase